MTATEVPSARRWRRHRRLLAICLFGACAIAASAVHNRRSLHLNETEPAPLLRDFVELEGVILELSERLNDTLSASVLNLTLPDPQAKALFAKQVTVRDLASDTRRPVHRVERPMWLRQHGWTLAAEPRTTPSQSLEMWRPLFESIDYFHHAHFSVVSGQFLDDRQDRIETLVSFEGLAATADGQSLFVKANQRVFWKADDNADGRPAWTIFEWRLDELKTSSVQRPLFAEVLDAAVADDDLRRRLRRSLHEQYILQKYDWLRAGQEAGQGDWPSPHPAFSVVAQDRHPGLAVVDIDDDGFDDLYVMARWGKNVLLHNQRDGTFKDVAADWGLDIDGYCSSAAFADIDNDGDKDLLLGRTLKPSLLLINEKGRFVDRSRELVGVPLPALVSAVSVADFNNDGLLDVYFSTYAAHLQRHEVEASNGNESDLLLADYLPEEQARELELRRNDPRFHRFLNNSGPPNVLLVNRGDGRLELAKESLQVGVWRHTFQATWGDYDLDGDQDLYLANDFAVNNLLRNDGPNGFVDVAAQTGTTDIGFGMGASWGDYDNDGRPDLYVSNMYSKAGRRITAQIPFLDRRFGEMARGNSLFRNLGDRFEKVSGLEPPALQVEKAGWSWGSQFGDVDNDGHLDIYALSGYYTAPRSVAVARDL